MIGLHNSYFIYLKKHLIDFRYITYMDLIKWSDYYNWIYYLNKDRFIWGNIYRLKNRQMNKRR
jgi:hypothetical protein